MRFFKLLTFVPFLWMLSFAPLAHAEETLKMGICNFSGSSLTVKGEETAETGDDLEQAIQDKQAAMDTAYESYSPESSTCGDANGVTGLVERADCNGKVITEVSEIVTQVNPASNGDEIVQVYQGYCCLLYTGSACHEMRTYYTDSLKACQSVENVSGVLPTSSCTPRQWLIASTAMGLFKLYVKQLFTFGSFIVGVVAVGTIIINGVRISVAGVSGDISDAKQKIMQSLSGIVLLFLSALILYAINPDFFGG